MLLHVIKVQRHKPPFSVKDPRQQRRSPCLASKGRHWHLMIGCSPPSRRAPRLRRWSLLGCLPHLKIRISQGLLKREKDTYSVESCPWLRSPPEFGPPWTRLGWCKGQRLQPR